VSQMLNCNCEPCLGAPYCTTGSPAPPSPSMAPGGRGLGEGLVAPGGRQFGPGSGSPGSGDVDPRLLPLLRRQRQDNPFNRPLYRDPFGVERGPAGGRSGATGGLYERLRSTTPDRRRF
jgi:hypothetical protein